MVDTTLLGVSPDELSALTSTKDEEVVAKVLNWFIYAVEHPREVKFREEAEEDFKFAKGDQWDEAVKKALQADKHPTLVINRIKKQVSSVVGSVLQNRKDIRAIPVDSSVHDLGISKLFSALIKHAMYKGMIQWHFDKAQKQSVIGGRGYMWPDIDYSRDGLNGEPVVEWVGWRDVYLDPDSKLPDASDATFVMKFDWMTDGELKERYPDKEKEIKESFANIFTGEGQATKLSEGDPRDGYLSPDKSRIFVDKKNGRIRVVECWYRTTTRQKFLVDRFLGKMEPFDGTEEDFFIFRDAIRGTSPERAAEMRLEMRTVQEIRFAVIAGGIHIVLEEGKTPYDKPPLDRMLPIILFVYDETDGMEEGIVRQLKDPQRETNKRRSKHMHFLNHWFPGIIVAEEGAEVQPGGLQRAMKDPKKIVHVRQSKKVELLGPPSPSEIFIAIDRESKQDFFDIGINPDLMGLESGAESGRAIMLKISQGQLQIAEPLTNVEWSYKLLGLWLMGLIQKTYNEPKVLQVMGPEGAEVLLEINQEGKDGEVVNTFEDLRNGNKRESFSDFRNIEFDVVVTTSAFAPTTRMAQFAMLTDMANAGYPIPAEVLIEATDLPNKQDLIRRLGEMMPSGPEQPNAEVQAQSARTGRGQPQ